jgi:hypothetical protein
METYKLNLMAHLKTTIIARIILIRNLNTAYNKAFASAGLQEKSEMNGKLINFMVGVRRAGSLKPGRCKAPNRYALLKEKTKMRHIRIIMTLIVTLTMYISYAQSVDLKIENKISELKQNSVDTIICYYENCVGEKSYSYDSCEKRETKYLFWVKGGKYYKQLFDKCNSYPINEIKESTFLKTALSQVDRIEKSEIKPVAHYNKDKNGIIDKNKYDVVDVDHTCFTNFEFHIKLKTFQKSINHFDLETKMLDDRTPNDNYETNQNSILKTLKELIEKEI